MLRRSIMVKLFITIKSKIILFLCCRNLNLFSMSHIKYYQCVAISFFIIWNCFGCASKHLATYVRRLHVTRQLMIMTIFSSNVRLTMRMQVEKQHQNKTKAKSFRVPTRRNDLTHHIQRKQSTEVPD